MKGRNKMTGKNTKPHNQKKSGRKAHEKKLRREQAEARNAIYQALSLEEKTKCNPKKFMG